MIMTPISDNLFTMEDMIIERLREKTTGFFTIASPSIIAGSDDVTQLLPAAFVQPGLGTKNADQDTFGDTYFEQRWSVFVAVPHWQSDVANYSASARAGPLMSQVIAALDGWFPDSETATSEPTLVFIGHSEPNGQFGFVSFELSFSTGLTI